MGWADAVQDFSADFMAIAPLFFIVVGIGAALFLNSIRFIFPFILGAALLVNVGTFAEFFASSSPRASVEAPVPAPVPQVETVAVADGGSWLWWAIPLALVLAVLAAWVIQRLAMMGTYVVEIGRQDDDGAWSWKPMEGLFASLDEARKTGQAAGEKWWRVMRTKDGRRERVWN